MSGRLFTIECRDTELAKVPKVASYLEHVEKQFDERMTKALEDFAAYGYLEIYFKRRAEK